MGEEAKVGRPSRKAEIRVSGLDEDTTTEDVMIAVARYGGCEMTEVTPGGIRRNRLGEGDIWIRCPWSSANELNRRGRIRIGWVGARVDLMDPTPMQCFRCWEYGHMKAQCRNMNDRIGKCYRCGGEGHKASQCEDAPSCILCKERRAPYNYRIGNRECYAKQIHKNGREKR